LTYQITVHTEEQMRVLETALECLMRMDLGQLLFSVQASSLYWQLSPEKQSRLRDEVLKIHPMLTGMNSYHASYGIGGAETPRQANLAYEMWKILEEFRLQDNLNQQSSPLEITGTQMIKIVEQVDGRN
jgi:hypothetical protein